MEKVHQNWNRIENLYPKIDIAARCLASRTGEDAEDLGQTMALAIIEQATETPTFLQQKDAFIVRYGSWRALDSVRSKWRDGDTVELDDELMGGGAGLEDAFSLHEDILQALDQEGRALVNVIWVGRLREALAGVV